MTRSVRSLQALSLLLAAAALAGCTTVEVAPPLPTGPPPSAPAEPADPARRAQVRLELAAAYFGRGQADTALEEVKLALAAQPDMPQALNLRGLIYASLGDLPQAEQSFKRTLQVAPRDADAMQNYGWFLCQQRRFEEAQAQFRAALEVPQYRGVVRTLLAQGVCFARDNRWSEAEAALMRSYELDPSNASAAYNLSEVLFRNGDLTRARFYIQRVNAVPDLANAQSLWLAARIEHRAGNLMAAQTLGRQLRERFPQSPETLQFERGRYEPVP